MIEPPKYFTDARRDYDLCDLEALSKWAIQLGLQYQPYVRASCERLIDVIGTQDFGETFVTLYDYIMKKQYQISITQHTHGFNNNYETSQTDHINHLHHIPTSQQQHLSQTMSAIAYLVPSKAKLIQSYPSFVYKRSLYSRSSFPKLDRRFSSPPTLPSRMMGWQFRKFPEPIPYTSAPAVDPTKIMMNTPSKGHDSGEGYMSTVDMNMIFANDEEIMAVTAGPVFGPKKLARYSSSPAVTYK